MSVFEIEKALKKMMQNASIWANMSYFKWCNVFSEIPVIAKNLAELTRQCKKFILLNDEDTIYP